MRGWEAIRRGRRSCSGTASYPRATPGTRSRRDLPRRDSRCSYRTSSASACAFLEWFYDKATITRSSIEPSTVDEYLRTFAGREGVLGAMGVYRAAFASTEQTEPLTKARIRQPVIAIGGKKGLGANVGTMVKLVAENVEAVTLEDCGHFVPEESPDEIVQRVLRIVRKTQR